MKNFRKKFLSAMLACLMLAPCAAGFASCDNGGNGGGNGENTEPTYGDWQFNDTEHWRERTVYDEEERGEHTYGTDGYTCTVCGYENEAKKPAQKQNAADYFGGMKVSYAREKITDADGTAKSFNEILDRQIDLLAQDILYRLNYVYGTDGTSNYTRPTDNYDLNYNFGDKKALIKPATILAEINAEHTHTLTNLKADCIDCYQLSLENSQTQNYFDNVNFIKLSGAISGRFSTLDDFELLSAINAETTWNLAKQFDNIQSSETKAYIKYGIAQILAGKSVNYTAYSKNNYSQLLNNIEQLGFSSENKVSLTTFIYNYIIGTNQAEKDLTIYNCSYFTNKSYIVDKAFRANAPYPGNTAYTEAEKAASPRLYKGYNIVVPAIVERAIENTFDGSEISLYPAMNRYAVQSFETLNGANTPQKYASIVLMPKTEISATKLAIKIKGANTIGVKCEINGKAVQVTASNDGELLLIDLHAYAKKIGAYNGSKENDFTLDLFGNSGAGAAGINNGENYIKLIFENPNGGKFSVEIDGYYDK